MAECNIGGEAARLNALHHHDILDTNPEEAFDRITRLAKTVLQSSVFLACLLPVMLLGWKAYNNDLGANPIEVITHATGDWTLRFLLMTLMITPLRKLTKQPWMIRYRRMLGLFAFFYVVLHFLTYIWLDKFFDFHEILADVAKRRFITVGFLGFLLLIPLALTSTKGWIRRLGGKRWQALHRLIYIVAIAGTIHYLWLVKADLSKPLQLMRPVLFTVGTAGLTLCRIVG